MATEPAPRPSLTVEKGLEFGGSIIREGMKWLAVCWVAKCVADVGVAIALAMAGKETVATINLGFGISATLGGAGPEDGGFDIGAFGRFIAWLLPWVITALVGRGWYKRTQLHKADIARLSARARQLELEMDPHRTTSGLLPHGDHPPDP